MLLTPTQAVMANATSRGEWELSLQAEAAILVEQTTGRVLYSRNAHARMYPASTTKILTALVAIQHLDMDTVVVVGQEIRGMPAGFATNLHAEGETITVEVLLKALLIRSSNEAGRILAIETIRTIDDNRGIQYSEAKTRFSQLMNQTARSLGATNSNFNNPYGLHSEFHYTTAYDMALIGRAFMEVPDLVRISAIKEFEGNSLGGQLQDLPQAYVRQYSWTNTNLMLPGATFGHPYIIAGRTGFTTPAGHCFVGGAYHNGLSLVSVVLYSEEPARWQDTRILIDHGFINYAFREIATEGTHLATVMIENPRRGDLGVLDILSVEGHIELLGRAEYAAIQREIIFDPLLLVEADTAYGNDTTTLRAPIVESATVGTVVYSISGETVFSAPVIAATAVYERTFDSDMDYYLSMIFGNIFTRRALPYWFGIFGTLFGIVNLILAITISRRARRLNNWHTPSRHR